MFRSKEIAFLGTFTALIAALRPLGLGAVGIEPMWFALILFSRALGFRLSIYLGALSMLLSAVITGGIGPWLPWQVLCAVCIAMGSNTLPNLRGKVEIIFLACYGIIAAEFYGLLMDLTYWPLAIGSGTQLSFDSHLAFSENAIRFLKYHFFGALAWDVPRAILTSTLIIIAGPSVLFAVRRSFKRAIFNERAMQP